jgi:hypothetical protein
MPKKIKFDNNVKLDHGANGTDLTFQMRSEMVQEILSRKPSFIERWALLLFVVILLISFGGSWFIKYPDLIEANATLTANKIPAEIISRAEGKLVQVFVESDNKVVKDQDIAWIESTADHKQVLELKYLVDSCYSLLQSNKFESLMLLFSKSLDSLGELKNPYYKFIMELQRFMSSVNKNLQIQNNPSQKFLFLKKKNATHNTHKEIKPHGFKILQQRIPFDEALNELRSMTEEWIDKYIIRTDIDGSASFTSTFYKNQTVHPNQVMGYIKPLDNYYYAKVTLAQSNFGRIDTGQKVLLRFEAYPYQEFGYVLGKIGYISNMPNDSSFKANVELLNGLTTNYGKHIPYKIGLNAQAIIIVKETRLLQRLYNSIFKKN